MKTLLMSLIIMTMNNFELPKLPYGNGDLAPVISEETMNFHYGKHLLNYVNTLNTLVKGTEFEGKDINYVVKHAPEGPMYNNAGQVLNHTFYFLQFNPKPKSDKPSGKLLEAINKDFGSFDKFKEEFTKASITLFGSGWAWLSVDKSGKLVITKETNGGNPVRSDLKPLLGFDVWEHSYYLDYQNRRADHIDALWSIIDWEVVGSRL